MRRFVFTFLLWLVASASLFAVDAIPAPDQQTGAGVTAPQADIEGWRTDRVAYPLAGAKLPSFSARLDSDTDLSSETLRGRWTIIGFQTGADDPAERSYIAALNSAVDQDPDLDLLFVYHIPDGVLFGKPPWPSIHDGGKLARLMRIEATPFYVLVGPDLTIHAYRGALSSDPDGIKSVIRGVAEIRRKGSAPQ